MLPLEGRIWKGITQRKGQIRAVVQSIYHSIQKWVNVFMFAFRKYTVNYYLQFSYVL